MSSDDSAFPRVKLSEIPEEQAGVVLPGLPSLPTLPAMNDAPSPGASSGGKGKGLMWCLLIVAGIAGFKANEFHQAAEAEKKRMIPLEKERGVAQHLFEGFKDIADKLTVSADDYKKTVEESKELTGSLNALSQEAASLKKSLKGGDPNEALKDRVATLKSEISKKKVKISRAKRGEESEEVEQKPSSINAPVESNLPPIVNTPIRKIQEDVSIAPIHANAAEYIQFAQTYLNARRTGNSNVMRQFFADAVVYQYSNYQRVSRSTVMRDIEEGWARWWDRSYSLIRMGVQGNQIEMAFSYRVVDGRGKAVQGVSKECWTLNQSGQIIEWREIKKTTSISPGFTVFEP